MVKKSIIERTRTENGRVSVDLPRSWRNRRVSIHDDEKSGRELIADSQGFT